MTETSSPAPASAQARLAFSGSGLVLLASMLWGTTGTAQSFAPAEAPSTAIGALRLVVAGLTLVALVGLRGGWRGLTLTGWPWRAHLLAALGVAAYQVTFFGGVRLTGVAVGTIIGIGSSPVFAGLMQYALHRRPPGLRWLVATGLAVAGCALLTFGGAGAEAEAVQVDPFGVLLTLGAGFSYALYTVASKGLVQCMPPDAAMAAVMGCGALLLLPFWVGTDLGWLTQPDFGGLLVVLHLGVVTTAVAYTVFARALLLIPAATAVTLTLMEPLTAAILGVVVVGEALTPLMLVGAGLVFAGLASLSVGQPARAQ